MMKVHPSLLIPLIITAAGWFGTACKARQGLPAKPRRWTVALDLSASPDQAEASRWTQACERLAAQLRPGDAVAVFGIHDNTLAAAPLFEASSVPIRRELGFSAEAEARKRFQDLNLGLRAAVRRAFELPRAGRTRIVDLFFRVQPGRDRELWLVLFSDMIEHSQWINLATESLAGREAEAARAVARRAGLQGLNLGGRAVCVLDDQTLGERPASVNDRRTLERFWRELFGLAGVNLVWFESYLPTEGDLGDARH
jgi:hypothetical protein